MEPEAQQDLYKGIDLPRPGKDWKDSACMIVGFVYILHL